VRARHSEMPTTLNRLGNTSPTTTTAATAEPIRLWKLSSGVSYYDDEREGGSGSPRVKSTGQERWIKVAMIGAGQRRFSKKTTGDSLAYPEFRTNTHP